MKKSSAKQKVESGDIENLNREFDRPTPRVLKPYILDNFGFNKELVGFLVNFFNSPDLYKRQKFQELRFNVDFNKDMNLKPIEVMISVSGEGIMQKTVLHPNDLEPEAHFYFKEIMGAIVSMFMEQIFPNYVHFLFKNTPLTPFPMPYFELYMKSDDCHAGNIFENIQEGDILDQGIL